MSKIKSFLKANASTIVAPQCAICASIIRDGFICSRCMPLFAEGNRCFKCWQSTNPADSNLCLTCQLTPIIFDFQRFLWQYNHSSSKIIKEMKYRGNLSLAWELGGLLANKWGNFAKERGFDTVVPIPSSKGALKSRGFNQCAEMAKSFSYITGIPLSLDALEHAGCKEFQARLPRKYRINNVKDAFKGTKRLKGKRILIVEDVITTGATSTSAGLECVRYGAKSVSILAIACNSIWLSCRQEIRKELILKRGCG